MEDFGAGYVEYALCCGFEYTYVSPVFYNQIVYPRKSANMSFCIF